MSFAQAYGIRTNIKGAIIVIKRIANRLFGFRTGSGENTVIIKVRINDHYTFYYPFTAKSGMKVREMNSDEFQQYLAAR